jgi:hypothetical protein
MKSWKRLSQFSIVLTHERNEFNQTEKLLTGSKKFTKALLIILFVSTGSALRAQDTLTPALADSFAMMHSPQKATIYSAALPGLGQIYNHRVWKTPIIYLGFGAFGYFIRFNNNAYNGFKKDYLYRTDGDPTTIDRYSDNPNVSEESLKGAMDTFRRWRDMNIFGVAGLYILQVIDASVDGYLFNFDISRDLSMSITPDIQPLVLNTGYTAGLKCTVTLKP